MEFLVKHGICLPPNMQGLTDEQIDELHVVDEWKSRCQPSGGAVTKKDPMQRRNGQGGVIWNKWLLYAVVDDWLSSYSSKWQDGWRDQEDSEWGENLHI